MKIIIAIDSFKGSVTSVEAGQAAAEGIKKAMPDAHITVLPVADGGEGTTEALITGLGGSFTQVSVTGPMGDKVMAKYGIVGETAVMEMAESSGLTLVPMTKRNPKYMTTYGLGEMILDAIEKGCSDFIIGIGGSATNDGGIGMLQALGVSFLDEQGKEVSFGAQGVETIHSISIENVPEKVRNCHFKIACDVNNPLCGQQGCSAVFAPQKGATAEEVKEMDRALMRYSELCKGIVAEVDPEYPGSGAAGGLGFAFRTFLNASLEPGVSIILDAIDLEKHVKEAELVLTGEGRIDAQTIMGKAPIGIAKLSKKYNKKVVALCGSVSEDASICNENGIDAIFSIVPGACSLEEAMEKSGTLRNIAFTCQQIGRLLSE